MPPVKSATFFEKVKAAPPSEATNRKRTIRLLVILLAGFIMGPIALLLAMTSGKSTPAPANTQPIGKAVADITAQQAISGQPIMVPTVSTLSVRDLDGPKEAQKAESVRLPYPVSSVTHERFQTVSPSNGGPALGRYEIHNYLLVPNAAAASGSALISGLPDRKTQHRDLEADPKTRYEIDQAVTDQQGAPRLVPQVMKITVAVDPKTREARLASAPAIEPWLGASLRPTGYGDYSNQGSSAELTSTAPMTAVVGKWAKAYVEDDRASLLETTGDLNTSRKYIGLGNMTLTKDAGDAIKILTASKVDGSTAVLRVRLKTQAVSADSETKKPSIQTLDFDLRLKNYGSGQPTVVAWGPAGSGFLLEPFSNGVILDSSLAKGKSDTEGK